MGKIPLKENKSETGVELVFDRTISVTRSTFSINEQTFLTRLGGSVSSGRTLLWILVTLLGAPQVKSFKVEMDLRNFNAGIISPTSVESK